MSPTRSDRDEEPARERHEAVVIGAGPAGLAAAAMLRREGVPTLVLEQASVGSSWRQHYDRLHLHTVRWLSSLPGLPIDRREGRWVSRDGVVRYLERYAGHHRLNVRAGVEVLELARDDGAWRLRTNRAEISAHFVVVATGFNREAVLPDWPGRASFTGQLLHSADYRNPAPYRATDVLVVGTGNSGAEIAVDLVEGGARDVAISVRTPPNILRRDVGGLPSQAVGVLIRRLPVRVVDRIAAVMQRLTVGDLTRYGMPPPPAGMLTRANQDSIPILDVGLIRLLKRRRVRVVPAVVGFDGPDVLLEGGTTVRPHAVIAATGFRRGLERLVGGLGLVEPGGRPVVHGERTHLNAPNLYFIGFTNPISGNLREIGIDARLIARAVARERAAAASVPVRAA
ncbi:MAG: NAD(P)/FAD-dependent oxidoreductase [Actinomycetota bacterium]|nr:NAD(P)/FAD-dependent oxidoreductase [Actinomycetota bacterium]